MDTHERKELGALCARSTDWLLDESHRIARVLFPDANTIAVGVAVDDSNNHSACVNMPRNGDKSVVAWSTNRYDVAETRQEALAMLILELREMAARTSVTIPRRSRATA